MRSFFAFVAGVASMIRVTAGADLAADHSGNLFLTAPNNNTILKFSSNGAKSTFATGVEGALAFDAAGNLFVGVSDATGTIFKLAPDGTKSTFAAGVGNPVSLTFDPAGNLYAYDLETGSIFKFAPDGTKSIFKQGKKPPGQMFASSSMNLACDRAGNLFAADDRSDTIFKFAPDGTQSTFATKAKATDLAFDPQGNLFAVNFWSSTIFKFAPDGTRRALKTKLYGPEGLAVDDTGNLFVYDSSKQEITKFNRDGTASTLAENKPEPAPTEKPKSNEEREAADEDSSTGLPEKYAKNYLIARSTISPNKKYAVIYPTDGYYQSSDNAKDYLVTLQPFSILRPLDTKCSYFEHESHGGLSAEWSDDSSVGLITLDSKWGPGDVLVVEFRDGKLNRMTNILRKAHDLLLPSYLKAKTERYNDDVDFVFVEDATFKLDGTSCVVIDAEVDTTPNDLGLSVRAWHGHVESTWDITGAKFTSKKVSGGLRKKRAEDPN